MATGEKLDKDVVRARCARSLSHHGIEEESPAAALAALAAAVPKGAQADRYGEGDLVQGFERELAKLLGKEAALFFPTGTMAQQIALRIWCDRRACHNVAFHPKCHLEVHEARAHQKLHGLDSVLVGAPNELITLAHLEGVGEKLGALLLELPQRDLGGRLPSWDALGAQCAWARARGVPLHLDGARLWESQPFYGRSYAEIAGLFGSVYVSFYKGLGAIAGAALAGPGDFIAEARVWRKRHGGAVPHLYPYVLSAKAALAARLGKMAGYHERAKAIAARLAEVPLVDVTPRPPDTNMMHVYLRGDREKLEQAALQVASETKTFLFGSLQAGPLPKLSFFELVVGDATMKLEVDEIGDLLGDVVDRGMA